MSPLNDFSGIRGLIVGIANDDVAQTPAAPPDDGPAFAVPRAKTSANDQAGAVAEGGGLHPPPATELLAIAEAARAARRRVKSSALDDRRRKLAAAYDEFRDARLPKSAPAEMLAAVRRAAAQGETRATVFTFPSEYCTDHGRAINNCESDWPCTLTGLARHYHAAFRDIFQPAGYLMGAEIVTWPDLMPGEVALFIQWHCAQAAL